MQTKDADDPVALRLRLIECGEELEKRARENMALRGQVKALREEVARLERQYWKLDPISSAVLKEENRRLKLDRLALFFLGLTVMAIAFVLWLVKVFG